MLDSTTKLIPLISKLGHYFKLGMDHYASVTGAGEEATPEMVSMFLYAKMADWNPKVGTISILDDTTRLAAAQMLGGVIVNLTKATS